MREGPNYYVEQTGYLREKIEEIIGYVIIGLIALPILIKERFLSSNYLESKDLESKVGG